jgi:hypothetical protein
VDAAVAFVWLVDWRVEMTRETLLKVLMEKPD